MIENKPNLQRRKVLNIITGVFASIGFVFAAIPFMRSLLPNDLVKALGAPLEVDISGLRMGEFKIIEWRGKPIWILRRSSSIIQELATNAALLADPTSKSSIQPTQISGDTRAINPEYLVLVGICTHLGCSPLYKPKKGDPDVGTDWEGGFFCPCHGSRFDMSGRVYKNMPAPTNLEVPPYKFTDKSSIIIGES